MTIGRQIGSGGSEIGMEVAKRLGIRCYDKQLIELACNYGELDQVIADARQAGLNLYVTSAYRSYDRQREVFDTTMKDWISKGYSPLDAYDETKKSVAVPGTSEHATGLAVDIISGQYTGLDDKQGDTAEQEWLMAHCQEYGFILRFPKDKSNVTGIVYEPWHYRYVVKTAAEEIMKKNLTLEEYLLQ